jgi:hypothetical protein
MKKVLSLLFIALFQIAQGQTTLSAGDIAFIGYNAIGSNAGAPNFVSFLVRKPIESGTIIYLTNQNWNSTSSAFDSPITNGKQGTIKLVFDEPASIGQIIEIIFTTTSSYLKTTVGLATYTSGNKFDFDPANDYNELYLYQYNTGYTFLTGMAWNNNAPSGSSIPPNMVFSGSSQNAFYNGTNGNNLKCGVWTPTNPNTAIAFSANLSTSFYDNARWNFVTSNTVSGGYCPCNPDSVDANITNNLYSIIENNITFDKYLYNKSGNWRQWNGTSWVALASGPDWGTNTRTKEVILNKSLSLGTANTNSTFECAKLTIQDTTGGDDGVTLTVESGNSLKIHQGLSFIDNGTLKPGIYLKSSHSGGQTYFATLDPTSAHLDDVDGNFKYDLHIQYPGWHHFQSPISATFSSISSSSSFQFKSGAVGTGNTFSWDATNSQWAPINLSDNFSSQPYTILFEATEVPCVLTVIGTLTNPDQDAIANLTASYHNPTSNGNVPGWTTDGDDGWNFYGNPFLSALGTEDLLGIFSSNGNGASNKMLGLDNKIFVWQPSNSVSNLTSDYKLKSFLSGVHGGDASATYLSPFQAFFMRRSSSNSNSTGFVKSKKYRKTVSLTTSNSIVNKTNSVPTQYELKLAKISTGQTSTLYAVPYGKHRFIDNSADILSPNNANTVFALAYDSSLFALKFWPINSDDTSSIDVFLSHAVNNDAFSISSSLGNTLLVDRITGIVHDFNNGPYTFNHTQTSNQIPRFQWIFNPKQQLADSRLDPDAPLFISISNNTAIIKHNRDESLIITDLSGRKVASGAFEQGTFNWDISNQPRGLYILSTNNFSKKFIIP